ncbi:MAG: mechanosensitive ion channel family protein [Spirulina sp. SIO3F2]|nr:mechanosensitive ion channel family protein [Spirulina sp. SIO3F2]
MPENLLDTIIDSLNDLLGSGIKFLPALLTALIILSLTRYGAEFACNVVTKLIKPTVKSPSIQSLIIKLTNITTWVTGILFAAVFIFPGLSLGDIVGTLGLSSVAIGFAFQDIFKNFLAGILLLLQEPFQIGDQIVVNDYEGTVERIDIRTTILRTYQGERVLLPNSEVFTSAVQVRTAFEQRRTDLAVGVDYNTPLSQAIEVLETVLGEINVIAQTPPPVIDLVSFGDSSIDFQVRYWTKSDQSSVCSAQTQVIVAIKAAFDQANIVIPYPIRTLYFFNQDGYNDYQPKGLS